ncbi:MAG: MFS transporter, partial [Bryobacteraceae bacterium]
GRRRSISVAMILAILIVPLWAYSSTLVLLAVGAFLLQFFVQGACGVIPAHLAELSPNEVRGFLPGFAYQCGVLLAASVAWLEAILAQKISYASAMALTAALVFVFAAVMAWFGQEHRGASFTGSK